MTRIFSPWLRSPAVRPEWGRFGITGLSATACDSADIIAAIGTNFPSYSGLSGNPSEKTKAVFTQLGQKTYSRILKGHLAEFQQYFSRVKLDLGTAADKPTHKRISSFAGGSDPQLAALMYQYGRYLLISSSRPGGEPANLQGPWNQNMKPDWESKFTTNINLEMNYRQSEVANLPEMNGPLPAARSAEGKRPTSSMRRWFR